MGDLGDVDEGVVGLQAFALPPPRHLSEAEKDALVLSSFGRVCASGGELELASGDTEDGGAGSQSASVNMWMMLLVRMVTRGPTSSESSLKSGAEIKSDEDIDEGAVDVKGKGRADQVDVRTSFRLRQTLCQYVLADFPSRYVGTCFGSVLQYLPRDFKGSPRNDLDE